MVNAALLFFMDTQTIGTISIKRADQHRRNTTKTESVDFDFTE